MKDLGEERSAAEGAPPRFECPADFRACAFAPGAPFTPGALREPSKKLLLIRAPANFSPESLDGHVLPLQGCQNFKVQQPNGTQKIYSVQTTQGHLGGDAHLLVPSGHLDSLTSAPPFSGYLSLWERYGDPTNNQPLFPVVARPAPRVPEGLKQRFLPFGGQLKRPRPLWDALGEPSLKKRKKKKKGHRQQPESGDGEQPELRQESWAGEGPKVPSRESAMRAGGDMSPEQEGEALCDGAEHPVAPEQGSLPTSSLGASFEEDSLAREEQSHRRRKKKDGLRAEENVAALLPLRPEEQLPEFPLQLQGDPEAQTGDLGCSEAEWLVQCKPKKKKKKKKRRHSSEEVPVEEGPPTGQLGLGFVKEEAHGELSALGSGPVARRVLAGEAPGLEHISCKAKKPKKKREKAEAEHGGEMPALELSVVKQEPGGWDELESQVAQSLGQGGAVWPQAEGLSERPKKPKKRKKAKRVSAEEQLGFIEEELASS